MCPLSLVIIHLKITDEWVSIFATIRKIVSVIQVVRCWKSSWIEVGVGQAVVVIVWQIVVIQAIVAERQIVVGQAIVVVGIHVVAAADDRTWTDSHHLTLKIKTSSCILVLIDNFNITFPFLEMSVRKIELLQKQSYLNADPKAGELFHHRCHKCDVANESNRWSPF